MNHEQSAYALCPGLKGRPSSGEAEHHCIGSTADNPGASHCGDFASFNYDQYGTGKGWNADLTLLKTTFMIFYR